jgi:hypothetical protein
MVDKSGEMGPKMAISNTTLQESLGVVYTFVH